MINPTGKGVRGHDRYGSGAYAATRTTAGKPRLHGGIDFVAEPGQLVVAPMAGRVAREARPYGQRVTPCNTGVWIESDERESTLVKLFYCRPLPDIIGQWVEAGDTVATAVSLQDIYNGITDHVHAEVWVAGRRVDPVPYFADGTLHVEEVQRA